jgi:hypothetical protein
MHVDGYASRSLFSLAAAASAARTQGRWQKKTGIITRARVFHTTGEMEVQILYYQEKENAILQRRGSIHFGG